MGINKREQEIFRDGKGCNWIQSGIKRISPFILKIFILSFFRIYGSLAVCTEPLAEKEPSSETFTNESPVLLPVPGRSRSSRARNNVDDAFILEDSPDIVTVSGSRCQVKEAFPRDGVSGKIVAYISGKIGVVKLDEQAAGGDKADLAVFHVAQVWQRSSYDSKVNKFLEFYSSDDLQSRFEIDKSVCFNARRLVDEGNYKLQATAVWSGKRRLPNYRTEALHIELEASLAEINNCITKSINYSYDPLEGMSNIAATGEIQEYVSAEMGLVRISGEDSVVLFHLNQVWSAQTKKSNNFVRHVDVQTEVLEQFLPVGTLVFVAFKPIPCNADSELKHQAVLLWKRRPEEDSPNKLLPEFLTEYSTFEKKLELSSDLEKQHNAIKNIWRLSKAVTSDSFEYVPIILEWLPSGWDAVIATQLSDHVGIIKVFHSTFGTLFRGIESFSILFHIEDVYNSDGVATFNSSSDISLGMLLNCHVDVVARSITNTSSPGGVIEAQEQINCKSIGFRSTPVMQAVYVFIREDLTSSINTSKVSKPTVIRKDFSNFNHSRPGCFLAPALRVRLDAKLAAFLKIPFKSILIHHSVIKAIKDDMLNEKDMLEKLKTVDLNQSDRFKYGKYTKTQKPKTGRDISYPKSVNYVEIEVIYLHRRKLKSDCGVVEFPFRLSDQSVAKLRAFFQLDQHVCVGGSKGFVQDLCAVAPLKGSSCLLGHAVLLGENNEIPYVVTSFWNEDDRLKEGSIARPPPPPHLGAEWLADPGINATICEITREKSASQVLDDWKRQEEKRRQEEGNAKRLADSVKAKSAIFLQAGKKTFATVLPESFLALPKNVLKVDKTTKSVPKSNVCLDRNGAMLIYLENIFGRVEKILSSQLAVISFSDPMTDRKRRALCTWFDVFIFDWTRGSPVTVLKDLFQRTASSAGTPLPQILAPGMPVRFDAIPLIPNMPYMAGIFYAVTGLIYGDFGTSEVPLRLDPKDLSFILPEFRQFFGITVLSLTQSLAVGNALTVPKGKYGSKVMAGCKKKLMLRAGFFKQKLPSTTVVVSPQTSDSMNLLPDVLHANMGVVTRLVNSNYGVGSFKLYNREGGGTLIIQFLFDGFDFPNSCCPRLAGRVQPGDFVKFNAVKVDGSNNLVTDEANLAYLATTILTSKNFSEANREDFSRKPALQVK